MNERVPQAAMATTNGPAQIVSGLAAILVVYDTHTDPTPVIERLLTQLACIVLVDNSTQGHPALGRWRSSDAIRLIHHRNVGGLAGAYNAALEWLARDQPQTAHVVFVDEDSDTSVLTAFLSDPAVGRLLQQSTTAAVAPVYRDRATGVRGAYMQLKRFRFRYLPREQRGVVEVAVLINSMSVWRRPALQQIGPFSELLGVDHVDTDYCMRARKAGLSLYVDGDHEFAHSIGKRRSYRLFGRTLQSGGYGVARRQMIGRNLAWLCRRYAFSEPAFALLYLLKLLHEAVGIFVAEDDRTGKLAALASGALAGFFGRGMKLPG